MKKVCFIPDYDNDSGRGHLGRCINLSHTFRNNNWKCYFFLKKLSLNVKIDRHVNIIRNLEKYHFNLIFLDSYKITKKKFELLKSLSDKICIIDDHGIIKFKSDFYLNYSSISPKNPKKLKGIKKLLGLKYLILKNSYNKNISIKKFNYNKTIPITIFYSSLSNYKIIKNTINELKGSMFYNKMKINIILTSEMKITNQQIRNFKTNNKIKVIFNSNKMQNFYEKSYFFIGSYGYSFIERLTSQTISINTIYAENQLQNSKFSQIKDLNISLKNINDLSKTLDKLICNPSVIRDIQKKKNLIKNSKTNANIFRELSN